MPSRIRPSLDARELWWQGELERMNERTAAILFRHSDRHLWIALACCWVIDWLVK